MNSNKIYRRILLKLSGEALAGVNGEIYDEAFIKNLCYEIGQIVQSGKEIGIVIGGGNIFRGNNAKNMGISHAKADHMGMLATAMNGIALQEMLRITNVQSQLFSATMMQPMIEQYNIDEAMRAMESGRVAIFVGGVGAPFFTTDTGAALRAIETKCDIILKGTQVDGVYSDDPAVSSNAVRYDSLSYMEILKNELKVMDATAISLAMNNNMPIRVFNIHESGSLIKVACGNDGRFTEIAS